MPTLDLTYVAVKHLEDTAIPFILNSWLKSYQWSSTGADYFEETKAIVKRLIKTNRLMVAAITQEPDCFVGWICGKAGELHYIYVKAAFRRDGIAKALIDKVCGASGVYSFKTQNKAFLRYIEKKGFRYAETRQRDSVGLRKKSDSENRIGNSNGVTNQSQSGLNSHD